MAIKKQFTLPELEALVTEYVDRNKIANTDFLETHDNVAGLLDKIGLIETVDTDFRDPLPEMNGQDLPFGRTIEEYFQDLILPSEYDPEGEGALKYYAPTFRDVSYNYTFGRRKIAISIKNNDVERAVNNAQELGSIVAIQHKRLIDSKRMLEYNLKREMIGKVIDLVQAAYDNATAYSSGEVTNGKTYTYNGDVYVAVKTGTPESNPVSEGYLIKLAVIEKVSKPTDRDTGNNFIVQAKKLAEIARDVSEGNSVNGNTISSPSLTCYMKQGILPELEVYTLAQTYHNEQLATNLDFKVIKDFGSTTSNAFAIVMDPRAIKLHKTYDVVRENFNGDGDFMNLFNHLEYTGFFSRNAFIHIYVDADAEAEKTSVKTTSSKTTSSKKSTETETDTEAE